MSQYFWAAADYTVGDTLADIPEAEVWFGTIEAQIVTDAHGGTALQVNSGAEASGDEGINLNDTPALGTPVELHYLWSVPSSDVDDFHHLFQGQPTSDRGTLNAFSVNHLFGSVRTAEIQNGSFSSLGSVTSPADPQTVLVETRVVWDGSTIDVYHWESGTSEPGTPTLTVTPSAGLTLGDLVGWMSLRDDRSGNIRWIGLGTNGDSAPTSPVGGGSLTVADAVHGHASESPALTQAHLLAVAAAGHGHLAESPTLTEAAQLAVDGVLHAHAVESPTLTQAHALTVAGAVHGHAVDELALVQAHVLSVAEALHGHAADSVTLDLSTVLSVDEALHAHSVDALSLTQAHVLVVQDALHDHAAEQVALTQSIIVALADARHGHAVETTALTQAHLLEIQAALHGHAADEPGVLAGGLLVVSDTLHAHLVGNLIFPGTVFQADRLLVVRGFDRVLVVAPSDRVAAVGPFDRVTVVKH